MKRFSTLDPYRVPVDYSGDTVYRAARRVIHGTMPIRNPETGEVLGYRHRALIIYYHESV